MKKLIRCGLICLSSTFILTTSLPIYAKYLSCGCGTDYCSIGINTYVVNKCKNKTVVMTFNDNDTQYFIPPSPQNQPKLPTPQFTSSFHTWPSFTYIIHFVVPVSIAGSFTIKGFSVQNRSLIQIIENKKISMNWNTQCMTDNYGNSIGATRTFNFTTCSD